MPEIEHQGDHLAAAPSPVPQPAAAPSAGTDSQVTDTQRLDWMQARRFDIDHIRGKFCVFTDGGQGVPSGERENIRDAIDAAIAALRAAQGAKLHPSTD